MVMRQLQNDLWNLAPIDYSTISSKYISPILA